MQLEDFLNDFQEFYHNVSTTNLNLRVDDSSFTPGFDENSDYGVIRYFDTEDKLVAVTTVYGLYESKTEYTQHGKQFLCHRLLTAMLDGVNSLPMWIEEEGLPSDGSIEF